MKGYTPRGKPEFAINIDAINAIELKENCILIIFEGGAQVQVIAPKKFPLYGWEADDWLNQEFINIKKLMNNETL